MGKGKNKKIHKGNVTKITKSDMRDYNKQSHIDIPNGITEIGEDAFQYLEFSSITIPSSVTTIGLAVFAYSPNLTSVVVESGNSVYDSRDNCNAIIETSSNTLVAGCQNTIIPNSVTSIGSDAFVGCSGLRSIEIPNSVTTIGNSAFQDCTGLTSVEIPNSVTGIGEGAFSGCSGLTSIKIPNSVTYIEFEAFLWCTGLTSVEIPDSVEYINEKTFYGCTSLTNIVIPNSVTTIGKIVFYGCTSLTSVVIPNSVTEIKESAFESCKSLTSIEIPDSVTEIGDYAFKNCIGLKSIVIPQSVIIIGKKVFEGCKNLKSVTIKSLATIKSHLFKDCTNIADVVLGDRCTEIDSGTFDNTPWLQNQPNGLIYSGNVLYKCKRMQMPGKCLLLAKGTTGIANGAIKTASHIRSIVIPSSVQVIGEKAFMGCDDLSYAVIPNSFIEIKHKAFWREKPKTELEIHLYPSLICDVDSLFTNKQSTLFLYKDNTNDYKVKELADRFKNVLKGVVVKDATSFMDAIKKCICSSKWGASGDGEFCIDGISDLNEIDNAIRKLKDKTAEVSTTLEFEVFSESPVLKRIKLPKSVTLIKDYAFIDCKCLETITIPSSVTEIEIDAFWGCDKLKTVYVEATSPLLAAEQLKDIFPNCEIVKYQEPSQQDNSE